MEDRLEPETRIEVESDTRPSTGGSAQASGHRDLEDAASELSDDTKLLISRCLDGTEPTGRELYAWETQKLSPKAVQAVLLRAAGFKGVEVAKLLGIDAQNVSIFCRHPYGQKILHAMMHTQGARVLDIKSKLEANANVMLDTLMLRAAAEANTEIVAKVTFGLLDRAGYGPKQIIGVERSGGFAADKTSMSRIADALEGSRKIDQHVTPHFQQKPPPLDAPNESSQRDPFAEVPPPLKQIKGA